MTPWRRALLSVLTVLGLGLGSGYYAFGRIEQAIGAIRETLPRIDPPGTYRPPLKTRILAADGTLLTSLYSENRELLPLEEMPPYLVRATIASEDRRFYEHIGVSPRDILRAAVANVRRGRTSEGASTITMQLARDLYLSRERTWDRKIREALLAVEIEKLYSKDEILELYLNQINYGKGAYGVRTAARMYFGKEPGALSLAECAALSAVPQRPADYHLYGDRHKARERRNQILHEMLDLGFISAAERDQARAEPLEVQPYEPPEFRYERAPYYTSWAIRELVGLLGEEAVYRGGLRVYTALDLPLQATAEKAVRAALGRAHPRGATAAAAVLLDPFSGTVLAMVGGSDWNRSQFNRATQARRQPGSSFKLFVYAAALDRGYRAGDTIEDRPFTWREPNAEPWSPKNYDGVYRGTVTLERALGLSINVAAARLAERVGIRPIIGYAQRMGIRSPLRPVRSLCLGTSEVTLLELTSAYGCLPTGGMACAPSTIVRVEDLDGRPIYLRQPKRQPALSPSVAYELVDMLRAAMATGTGKPAAFGVPHGGKTGTTQNARDAWFIGFTPRYVCGVWLGNDDARRSMHGVYGGTFCGPAWKAVMQAAVTADGGPGEFMRPDWATGPTDLDEVAERIVIRSRTIPAAAAPAEKAPDELDEAVQAILDERARRASEGDPAARARPPEWYDREPVVRPVRPDTGRDEEPPPADEAPPPEPRTGPPVMPPDDKDQPEAGPALPSEP